MPTGRDTIDMLFGLARERAEANAIAAMGTTRDAVQRDHVLGNSQEFKVTRTREDRFRDDKLSEISVTVTVRSSSTGKRTKQNCTISIRDTDLDKTNNLRKQKQQNDEAE